MKHGESSSKTKINIGKRHPSEETPLENDVENPESDSGMDTSSEAGNLRKHMKTVDSRKSDQ